MLLGVNEISFLPYAPCIYSFFCVNTLFLFCVHFPCVITLAIWLSATEIPQSCTEPSILIGRCEVFILFCYDWNRCHYDRKIHIHSVNVSWLSCKVWSLGNAYHLSGEENKWLDKYKMIIWEKYNSRPFHILYVSDITNIIFQCMVL